VSVCAVVVVVEVRGPAMRSRFMTKPRSLAIPQSPMQRSAAANFISRATRSAYCRMSHDDINGNSLVVRMGCIRARAGDILAL
jgi:hypothetical protein